ncbi:hypothetical protein HMPREF1547_01384 [Blautia sp. KLE 1732]|nr:hypothetical protein HMPREF1547_01384 [Blautia sp. KLE 1732]
MNYIIVQGFVNTFQPKNTGIFLRKNPCASYNFIYSFLGFLQADA